MTKENKFKVGMALHHIALTVCDADLKKIEPYLKDIENTVADEPLTVNVLMVTEDDLSGIMERKLAE